MSDNTIKVETTGMDPMIEDSLKQIINVMTEENYPT
jgi:hypothetical protein